jgi:hypothetical protein
MEPFLVVQGKLRKDGATLNVIAEDIQALRPERGGSRSPSEQNDSFSYLSSLRESPPGVKSFG